MQVHLRHENIFIKYSRRLTILARSLLPSPLAPPKAQCIQNMQFNLIDSKRCITIVQLLFECTIPIELTPIAPNPISGPSFLTFSPEDVKSYHDLCLSATWFPLWALLHIALVGAVCGPLWHNSRSNSKCSYLEYCQPI